MRTTYGSMFTVYGDGSVSPKENIRLELGGVQIGLSPGARFTSDAVFGGYAIAAYVGHDLEVDRSAGVARITAIYQK